MVFPSHQTSKLHFLSAPSLHAQTTIFTNWVLILHQSLNPGLELPNTQGMFATPFDVPSPTLTNETGWRPSVPKSSLWGCVVHLSFQPVNCPSLATTQLHPGRYWFQPHPTISVWTAGIALAIAALFATQCRSLVADIQLRNAIAEVLVMW